jgi:hypothetical protein
VDRIGAASTLLVPQVWRTSASALLMCEPLRRRADVPAIEIGAWEGHQDRTMKVLNENYLLKQAFRVLITESIRRPHQAPLSSADSRCFFGEAALDHTTALRSPQAIERNGISMQASLVSKYGTGRAGNLDDSA